MSEVPVNVIDEVEIPSVWEYLKSLEKDGELKIYRYPSRPNFYPTDDSDLIECAICMYIQGFDIDKSFEMLENYHPELHARIEKTKRYLKETDKKTIEKNLIFFK